jgi:hypothetical protein
VFDAEPENDEAPGVNCRGPSEIMERETGFEPATLSLGKAKKTKKRREDAPRSLRGRTKGGKERQ